MIDERELIMLEWDKWRAYIAGGGQGSWPRDAFEMVLDQFYKEDTIKWPDMPEFQLVAMEAKGKLWYKRFLVWIFSTRKWRLTKDYEMPCGMIIEKGFVVDGASIPKLLRWLVSPTGPLFIPSLKHDKGYRDNPGDKKKLFWDKEFRNDSMEVNGIYVLSYGAWMAVAGFAWTVWWKHRRNEVA